MEQIRNYKNIKNFQRDDSDEVEYTFVTKKAIVFYISSVLAIVTMFMNWLPLDIDLKYLKLRNVIGTMNAFTLPFALGDLKKGLGVFGSMLPEGYDIAQFFSVILILICGVAIVCYIIAIIFRAMGRDESVRIGKLGAVATTMGAVGFLVMACVAFSAVLGEGTIFKVVGIVLKSPWTITFVCSFISHYCAIRNMEPKEDIVTYHDGKVKISRGPKWNCRCCRRKNLDLLEKCYYCGHEK